MQVDVDACVALPKASAVFALAPPNARNPALFLKRSDRFAGPAWRIIRDPLSPSPSQLTYKNMMLAALLGAVIGVAMTPIGSNRQVWEITVDEAQVRWESYLAEMCARTESGFALDLQRTKFCQSKRKTRQELFPEA